MRGHAMPCHASVDRANAPRRKRLHGFNIDRGRPTCAAPSYAINPLKPPFGGWGIRLAAATADPVGKPTLRMSNAVGGNALTAVCVPARLPIGPVVICLFCDLMAISG
jgi:hypothetical protein